MAKKDLKKTLFHGTSANRVYVTLNNPAVSSLFETVLDIAVRNSDGLTDADSVVAAIYDDFTDRSVRRKPIDGFNIPDGAVMQYWTEEGGGIVVPPACQSMETMIDPTTPDNPLTQNVGTCVAWSDLLVRAWRAHGIADSFRVEIRHAMHANGVRMLVNNWTFVEPGTSTCPGWPYRNFMYETNGMPGDEAIDVIGAPGQNVANPPGVFFNHYIVWRNNIFYDPSYGSPATASFNAWENGAFAGWVNDNCASFTSVPLERASRKNDPDIVEVIVFQAIP